MPLNKLQIKAQVFKCIENLRNLSAIDDFIVEETLSKLRAIEDADFEFISRLLIKEADCKNQRSATIFLYLAENLSPESFIAHLLNELNSSKVADDKKIFLLNILSGLGITFLPEDMGNYLENPDEAINSETSRFLENAKIDPEARIDFLDFYFASPEIDRRELVDSVVSDFSGDRLVNILSPLILSIDEEDTVLYCLDIIEKSKSLLAIKPLKYLERIQNSKKIAKQASKILRKMRMSGFYTEEKYYDYNRELMEDFEEPECVISTPDGNSNFSIVISRKNKNGSYYIMFSAVNAALGPFSCFGFSSITKKEYETVTERFFSDFEKIYIPKEEAKALLSNLAIKRIEANKIIPYEFFCWERMLDDIIPVEKTMDEILQENLNRVELDENKTEDLLSLPYTLNWFFRYSKSISHFSNFIDEVLKLNKSNIEEIENIVDKYSKDSDLQFKIATRLNFLSYCLLRAKKKDLADKFYSLLYNPKCFDYFMKTILQKSVYEHMLNMKMPKKSTPKPFYNKTETTNEDEIKTAEFFISYIENNWVEED